MDALAEGRVDLVLGFVWNVPDTILREKLYEESYLVAGRPEALPDAPSIDVDAYCAADHILISPGGDLRGIVDERLEAIGRTRRVILALPAFLPALVAASVTRALITLPSRLAKAFAPGFGLVMAEPPIQIRRFPVSVFWHRRNKSNPRVSWVKTLILDR